MKKFKKFLAILLVASMVLTTNAASVFAEGISAGTEEQLNEETFETTEEVSELEEETRRGERLSEPALEEEETEAELEEEAEETTVGSNEHGASPEDEVNSTEAKLGESEIELELDKKKKDDQLYGDDPKKFYVVFYYNDENYSSWTLSESNIPRYSSIIPSVNSFSLTPNSIERLIILSSTSVKFDTKVTS